MFICGDEGDRPLISQTNEYTRISRTQSPRRLLAYPEAHKKVSKLRKAGVRSITFLANIARVDKFSRFMSFFHQPEQWLIKKINLDNGREKLATAKMSGSEQERIIQTN